VVGDRNPNRLEASYSKWARELRERGSACLGGIRCEAESLCPDDTNFKEGFLALEQLKAPTVRYILRKINDHMIGREGELKTPAEVHVEHILPRSPKKEWLKTFSSQEAAECRDRLGNLTLLSEPLNKKASNKAFSDKLSDCYTRSNVRLTTSLSKWAEWNPKAIEERQAEFADMACEIWAF